LPFLASQGCRQFFVDSIGCRDPKKVEKHWSNVLMGTRDLSQMASMWKYVLPHLLKLFFTLQHSNKQSTFIISKIRKQIKFPFLNLVLNLLTCHENE